MGYSSKIWKIAPFSLLFIFLALIFLIPLVFKINQTIEQKKKTPISKQILEKFSLIKKKDSLALWNENRDWIFEYNTNSNLSIDDQIKTTNIKYKKKKFKLRYKWYNKYSKQKLKLNFDLPYDVFYSSARKRESVKDFSKYLRRIQDYLYNDFFLYSEFYLHDKDILKRFSEQFLKFRKRTRNAKTEIAYNVITFVQHFEYIRMKEYNIANDTLLYVGAPDNSAFSNRAGDYEGRISMTRIGPTFMIEGEKIKHEVFSPVEFLKYGKGDCDSRTILAFTLLKNLDYDVVTIRIHYYDNGKSSWHSMLGIAGVKSADDNYFEYKNKKYYYVELTKKDWQIGELTPDQKQFGRMIGMDMPAPKLTWGDL